jgi:hypothetical protein
LKEHAQDAVTAQSPPQQECHARADDERDAGTPRRNPQRDVHRCKQIRVMEHVAIMPKRQLPLA